MKPRGGITNVAVIGGEWAGAVLRWSVGEGEGVVIGSDQTVGSGGE